MKELQRRIYEAISKPACDRSVSPVQDGILQKAIRSAEAIANNKTHTSAIRLFALDAAHDVKAGKEELLGYYKAELEE